MKFKPNANMTTIAIYAFLVIAASILFALSINGLSGIFGWFGQVIGYLDPVIYGICIAFLLNPMLRTYEVRLLPRLGAAKLRPVARRVVSLLLTYFSALIILAVFLAIVLPQLVRSCVNLADNIPLYFKALQNFYRDVTGNLMSSDLFDEPEFVSLLDNLSVSLLGMMQTTLESFGTWLTDFGTRLINFAGDLASTILNAVVGVIISAYLLADREKLFAQLRKICAAIFPKSFFDLLYGIAVDTNRVFSGFIIGKIIDSLIIGILCFIGMLIFRMPYAVLISVIVGVTNVIPYFGPFIGAIPGFLIILISDPVASLWFLLFILLLQQFDGNILGPKILGDTTGLSALWVIVSIMLFSGLFGVLGMFIGVPLFAVIYSMIKRMIAYLLRRKSLPTGTRDYSTEKNPLIK